MCFETWNGYPDEPRKRHGPFDFHSPESKPVFLKVVLDPQNERFAFLRRQRRRKVLHHLEVSIQRSKWLVIRCTPSAEEQSLGSQLLRCMHGCQVQVFGDWLPWYLAPNT
jgi:hypothetical protein